MTLQSVSQHSTLPLKTIFQVYPYQQEFFVPGRPQQLTCCPFPTITNKWPFQDHLLSRILSRLTALSCKTLKATMWSLFLQCQHQVAYHFKMFLKYYSTNSTSSVS